MTHDDCIEWSGTRTPNGYGRVWRDGKWHQATHAVWEAAYGSVPEGMVLMHSCDTPWCVNLAHLSVGSRSDNSRDMVRKGRHSNGNRDKSRCPSGHPYDDENTRWSNGKRYCRACDKGRLR